MQRTIVDVTNIERQPLGGEVAPPTILVADDDAVMRTFLMEVLRAAGYSVLGAADGETAVEMARAHRPQAIILDLLMPVLSGNQVVAAVRSTRAIRRVPVIMVSGIDKVEYRVQALTAGAQDFLVKPVAPTELVARLAVQLQIASMEPTEGQGAWDVWRHSVVRDNAFDIVFQPVVDLCDRRVIGYEALTRFHDALPPLGALEHDSSIEALIALEVAAVRRAIDEAATLAGGAALHLKVSPSAVRSNVMLDIVSQAQRPCVLEITANERFTAADAQALRAGLPNGCRIATDVVGARYGGLEQLLDVRPEVVKIDKAVVSWIDEDPARQALVAGLVQFGAATGCTLIANGVSRSSERDTLLALGVEVGQGQLFDQPASWPQPDPATVSSP